jgi:hypothetical protein
MIIEAIARLKIALDDVKPVVMSRIEVPLTIKLDRFHLTIDHLVTPDAIISVCLGGFVGISTINRTVKGLGATPIPRANIDAHGFEFSLDFPH